MNPRKQRLTPGANPAASSLGQMARGKTSPAKAEAARRNALLAREARKKKSKLPLA